MACYAEVRIEGERATDWQTMLVQFRNSEERERAIAGFVRTAPRNCAIRSIAREEARRTYDLRRFAFSGEPWDVAGIQCTCIEPSCVYAERNTHWQSGTDNGEGNHDGTNPFVGR